MFVYKKNTLVKVRQLKESIYIILNVYYQYTINTCYSAFFFPFLSMLRINR